MPERYHPAAAEMGGSIGESGAELRLHLATVRGFGVDHVCCDGLAPKGR